jgi:hypothetical protein
MTRLGDFKVHLLGPERRSRARIVLDRPGWSTREIRSFSLTRPRRHDLPVCAETISPQVQITRELGAMIDPDRRREPHFSADLSNCALGFRKVDRRKAFPATRPQRCWWPPKRNSQIALSTLESTAPCRRPEPALSSRSPEGLPRLGRPLRPDRRDGNVDLLLHGSSCRATFSLFNNDIAAARPALSAFSAHSAFGFCANAKADTADHHTYTGRWTFFNNPASLGSRFLNNVVVRQ